MKKILALLLAFVLVFTLCACGSSEKSSDEKDGEKTEASAKDKDSKKSNKKDKDSSKDEDEDKDEEEDEDEEDEVAEDEDESEEEVDESEEEVDEDEEEVDEDEDEEEGWKPSGVEYTISNEVIVDDENCTFKIVKAEEDEFWGFILKAFCENKTDDTTLMFSIDNVSVNGYMVDPYWATEVSPGKKLNDEISFSTTDFENIGITSADEITFTLSVYDSDDWSADDLLEDTFTIYPTGLSKDEIVYPERISVKGEQVVVDNDDICFVILGEIEDSYWGYDLRCYVENKTDSTLMFTWNDVSVNGYMVEPYWALDVAPGMRSYSDICFSPSDFESNDITDVEEIEFSMRVYDYDDWSADDLLEDTFTYNP